ncbi:helix-turn-helix domain-containing protein [Candidatus Woesearchaeota archaeon]|nr:helix-turn-helix domain-containing protein [Candidatus Woesearchaeota archaeon]
MKRTIVPKKEHFADETATERLLRVFYWFPEVEFSLSELARQAVVSKSTASRLLNWLKKRGAVKVIDRGVILRIQANTESLDFLRMKTAHNLKLIYASGLVEFLNDALRQAKTIVLIGSFRRGEDISTSDIDIAVETVHDIETKIVRPEGLERYERYFGGKKIEIHLFNRSSVDINFFNNVANGIVLSGFLEVKP